MPLKCELAFASEKGPRPRNEDSVGCWAVSPTVVGLAVADGLGGHSGGQRASKLAVTRFEQYLRSDMSTTLEALSHEIHDELRMIQQTDIENGSMATTFSAAVIVERTMRLVHCGDTRISLQRGVGIKRLTIDHTEAQRFLDEGLLTKEQFDAYPRRNILESALGIRGTPTVHAATMDLQGNDRLFLSSDGFHAKVLLREVKKISDASSTPEEFVASSMLQVLEREPDDNYTVAAAFFSDEEL